MTFEELQEIMADAFGCSPQDIQPDSTPDSVPTWDSLRLLDLVLAIEQRAGIEIDTERLQDMMSVPAILEIVNQSAR